MSKLTVWVFDVERGLCVLVQTPAGYGVLIDCGRSRDFSPAQWIADNLTLTPWLGHNLAWMIVTHPHDDHVEDIQNLKRLLPPALLDRHDDYDWQTVLNPPDGDPSENAKAYYQWQATYLNTAFSLPPLGLNLETLFLSPRQAAHLDPNPQHSLNNSSYVTVFTWQTGHGRWKVVVAGDNETKGSTKLLEQPLFRDAITGAHFLVTPHHGHASGFCKELFDVMGKPLLNVTSEREGDQSVYAGYLDYAEGWSVHGADRKHLTTRCDGHITITMNDRFECAVETSKT